MDLCFFSQPFFRGFSIDFLMPERPDPEPPSPGITLLDLADSKKYKKPNKQTDQKLFKLCVVQRWSQSNCVHHRQRVVLTIDISVKAPQHCGPRRKQLDPSSFLFRLFHTSYDCSIITQQTLHNLKQVFQNNTSSVLKVNNEELRVSGKVKGRWEFGC